MTIKGIEMGTVRSKAIKAVRATYETESRMHKVIGKDKPIQAPRHPTTVAAYEKLINGMAMVAIN